MSTPSGRRSRKVLSSSGSPAANSSASISRNSSGRSCRRLLCSSAAISSSTSSSPTTCGFARPISVALPRSLNRSGRRCAVPFVGALAQEERRERRVCCISSAPSRTISSTAAKLDAITVARIAGSTRYAIRIFVEPAPVAAIAPTSRSSAWRASASDHTLRGAKRTRASALLLALLRIGGEQVVERRGPFGPLDVGDRLRRAAAEHVAAELRAPDQLRRRRRGSPRAGAAAAPARSPCPRRSARLAVASPAAAGAISGRRATPPSPDSRRRARAARAAPPR